MTFVVEAVRDGAELNREFAGLDALHACAEELRADPLVSGYRLLQTQSGGPPQQLAAWQRPEAAAPRTHVDCPWCGGRGKVPVEDLQARRQAGDMIDPGPLAP